MTLIRATSVKQWGHKPIGVDRRENNGEMREWDLVGMENRGIGCCLEGSERSRQKLCFVCYFLR